MIQNQESQNKQDIKVKPMSEWVCRPLHERYTLGKQLGHGAYGAVYQAYEIDTQKNLHQKKMENFYEKQDKEGRPYGFPITTLREIKLLQHLQHQNILTINDVVFERPQRHSHKPPTVYLCLPLMQVDLGYVVSDKQYQFTPYRLQKIIQQILKGLSYLHSKNVAHRDLKPANILINRQGLVKIGDFGLAKKLAKFSTPKVVTMWYRAPQLLFQLRTYSTNIDIWSLGCLLVQFLIRKPLFYECQSEIQLIKKIFQLMGTPQAYEWHQVETLQKYQQVKPDFVKQSEIILHVKKIAPAYENNNLLLDLIQKMLRLDPRSRYSAAQCLDHPFFAEQLPEQELLPQKIITKKITELKKDTMQQPKNQKYN